jgi:hypothetical protein
MSAIARYRECRSGPLSLAPECRPQMDTKYQTSTPLDAFRIRPKAETFGQWSFTGANLRGIRWEKEPMFPEPIDDLTIAPSIDHVNILREPISPTLRAMPPMIAGAAEEDASAVVEYSLSPSGDAVIGGGDSGGGSSSGDSGCGGGCS